MLDPVLRRSWLAGFCLAHEKGTTVLLNAARDPEVTDTANMLNQLGAKITGAGTETIRIEGVSSLHGGEYTVIPDRLIAGAFLMAAGVTGGSVILRAVRVRTAMYPGFATDLQQPLTALLTQARGKSIIGERIYPHRFNHAHQLVRMGADIKIRPGVASIQGGKPLHGTLVHASDVRAGICLILAGLRAEGTTTIAGVQHIERGYEDVVGSFLALGANICMFNSEEDYHAGSNAEAK